MNKKISFLIAIIIILACAVLIGIIAWQYRFIPEIEIPPLTPSEKIPKDETADWKIYRNKEYGFEVKYPQNWGLEILSNVPSSYIEGIDIIQPYNEVYKPGSFVGKDLEFLMISSSSMNLDNIIKDNKAEEINLGNVMAWRYKRQKPPKPGPGIMVLTEEVTLILDKDFYIEISESANYGPEDYSYRSRTISTILSTFRFLERI